MAERTVVKTDWFEDLQAAFHADMLMATLKFSDQLKKIGYS